MGKNAGALLWNRRHFVLVPGITTIDTELQQVGKAFAAMSPGEPPLGVTALPPGPADGSLPASRVQVIPQAPLGPWFNVSHGEPFLDPSTGTVKVTFNNGSEGSVTINALFWNPHSVVGPGKADPYTEAPQVEVILTNLIR
jgi:hypothetical protein